jgi:hypothetical protein
MDHFEFIFKKINFKNFWQLFLAQYGNCILAFNQGNRRWLNDQWEKKSSEKYEGKIRRTKTHFPYCEVK